MHVHNVYFWMADDLSGDDLAAFEQGLKSLTEEANVVTGYYGKPANTHRDVVERSYGYGLVLVFADLAGHESYQVSDVHQAFVDAHLGKWTKVIVHDIAAL